MTQIFEHYLAILLISGFTLSIAFTNAMAAVLVVGQDGWQPFTTIQSAVDIAVDGDVIKVMQGIYAEQVVVRDLDDLMIEGDQATISVPDAGMTGSIVKLVNCQEFNFTGFTIDGKNGAGVGYGSANGGGDADTRFIGLFVINSSG